MNPARLFTKLKPPTIKELWGRVLILGAILLLAALWADWLIYKNFVTEKQPISPADENSLVILKKPDIIRAGQKLREKNAFIENPNFPFVNNPF